MVVLRMNSSLQPLRDAVANISEPSNFSQSIRALEDAFDYDRTSGGVSWRWLREGSDSLFFGDSTLSTLFGDQYAEHLSDRAHFNDFAFEYAPGVSSELRLEFQRYAVVGRRLTQRGEQAACLVLHASELLSLDAIERPADEHLAATAHLRLRAALMNRRQAVLLANHLNRFRNHPRHRERLNWSVVQGPGPNSDARTWADAVLGRNTLLRAYVGATDSWGVGPMTAEKLAIYGVQVQPIHARQVFSYGPAEVVLPPRYVVSAEFRGQPDMPNGSVVSATRAEPCESSTAMARIAERAGLIHGAGRPREARLEDLWGPILDGVPGSDERTYMLSPAEVYGRSLSRSEAIATIRALRKHGFWRVAARRVGADGSYLRYEGGHPGLAGHEVTKFADFSVSIGGAVLPVRLLTCSTSAGDTSPANL